MSAPYREVNIGDARLILGDCRDVLPGLSFDAVVSDPPYGINYRHSGGGSFVSNMGPDAGRSFKRHNAPIVGDEQAFDPAHLLAWPCALFGANHYCKRLPDGGSWHVWDKHCGKGTDDDFADVEFVWMSWKTKSVAFRHLWKGVLRDSETATRHLHPSQKPVAVMAEIVRKTFGRVVCDPYMGSASTGVACARLGRPFVGIELDPGHFSTACRRIEAAYRQADLFVEPPVPRPEQVMLDLLGGEGKRAGRGEAR